MTPTCGFGPPKSPDVSQAARSNPDTGCRDCGIQNRQDGFLQETVMGGEVMTLSRRKGLWNPKP
jgi:hypothetical protein